MKFCTKFELLWLELLQLEKNREKRGSLILLFGFHHVAKVSPLFICTHLTSRGVKPWQEPRVWSGSRSDPPSLCNETSNNNTIFFKKTRNPGLVLNTGWKGVNQELPYQTRKHSHPKWDNDSFKCFTNIDWVPMKWMHFVKYWGYREERTPVSDGEVHTISRGSCGETCLPVVLGPMLGPLPPG